MKRKTLVVGVALALALAGGAVAWRGPWFQQAAVAQAPSGARAVPVEIAKAVKQSVPVRLEASGARTLWAAVIHEGVEVGQDDVGRTQVTVGGGEPASDAGPPPATDGGVPQADGGEGIVVDASHGCTETGATPAWALAAAALAAARRKRSAAV